MGKKSELTRLKIIESATYCLLNFGDRKTTFQTIADHCKMSQSLVIKYLKTREGIFPVVLDFWIAWAREKTEGTLIKSGSAEEKLRDYINASIELFNSQEFARIYLLLQYFAGVEESYRLKNSEIKKVAVHRIMQIIEEGIISGEFKKIETLHVAKTIHNSLVGFVLSRITESPQSYFLKLPQQLEEMCLALVLSQNETMS
jgi:AcrR family transcriptional regulator